MRLDITVGLDNDAFIDERNGELHRPALAELIREAADLIANGVFDGRLRDMNGNTCGTLKITP